MGLEETTESRPDGESLRLLVRPTTWTTRGLAVEPSTPGVGRRHETERALPPSVTCGDGVVKLTIRGINLTVTERINSSSSPPSNYSTVVSFTVNEFFFPLNLTNHLCANPSDPSDPSGERRRQHHPRRGTDRLPTTSRRRPTNEGL